MYVLIYYDSYFPSITIITMALYACVAEERGDARFAGCLRKGAIDEKVLIRLQVDEDTGSGSIQLRCDDPIVAASLIDVLKKAVST